MRTAMHMLQNTRFFSKYTGFFSKPCHFIPDFSPNHADIFFPKSSRVYLTVLDSYVVRKQAGLLKIMIFGDWRRRSTWKTTKMHLQSSANHTGFFSKSYQIFFQPFVWLDVILQMSSRICLQKYHIFLQKSSNYLDCAGKYVLDSMISIPMFQPLT
jgi:hypothetical protein